jgi:hypothetical protein
VKTGTTKLLLGIILLVTGTFLLACGMYFLPFYFFFGAAFFVAGLVLLAPLIPWKVKLLLGVALLLAGILILVYGTFLYITHSVLFIFAGLAFLATLAAWKARLSLGAALFLAGIFLLLYQWNFMIIFSLPLIVSGLLLLATLAHGKTTDLKKPAGVTIAGAFALLSSIGLGLLSYFAVILASVGFSSSPSDYAFHVFSSFSLPLAVLALSGLFLSIVVLRGLSSKYLWYILMAYWISLLAFSSAWVFTSFGSIGSPSLTIYSLAIFVLPTYVYTASCIAYFSTKKPRQYFHLIAVKSPQQQATV